MEEEKSITTLAPWLLSDQLVKLHPNLADDMSENERTLRLQRMWLTGALSQKGSPEISPYLSKRKVANFWIIAALMRSLSLPVKGTRDLKETRSAVLIRSAIHARGWSQATENHDLLVERVSQLAKQFPTIPKETIFIIMFSMANEEEAFTPEISDTAFSAIIAAVDDADLEHYTKCGLKGRNCVRFPKARKIGPGLSFLTQKPPRPGICLRERANTGAAYLSEENLSRRMGHIFSYPVGCWEISD